MIKTTIKYPKAECVIRHETPNDQEAIREIHRLAFNGPAEAKLVDDLRASRDAIISLIAEWQGKITGHVLFSKLQAPMKALALAPVAVLPSLQNKGIGSALVRDGLRQAKEEGWEAVFVLGDPAYYGRFGFLVDPAKGYASPYSGKHFMILPFEDVARTGQIIYPAPFKLLD